MNKLTNKVKSKPEKNFVIFIGAASHGLNEHGRQVIVTNECDTKIGFYRTLPVESKVRAFTKSYLNTYIIVIFACCRETLFREKHSGGISR